MRIGFLGAGRWALALASGFDRGGHTVALWEKDAQALSRLENTRNHPDLPADFRLPEKVIASGSVAEVLNGTELVVFAVPSSALSAVVQECGALLPGTVHTLVTVTKGIDPATLRRLSTVISATVRDRPVVVLAGPGIPYDFARGDPTSLVAAAEEPKAAELVRDAFTAGNLRIYSSPDVVGVELGAALKNVIALAAGIAQALGLGINAQAALLTRGLAEITRLGIALNANPLTFSGLAGMGDLIVTAFSEHSRNHRLGWLIGQGQSLTQAQQTLHGIAEGAATCLAARNLSLKHHVEMPICTEVYRILYEGADPAESLHRLLRRTPKKEV